MTIQIVGSSEILSNPALLAGKAVPNQAEPNQIDLSPQIVFFPSRQKRSRITIETLWQKPPRLTKRKQ